MPGKAAKGLSYQPNFFDYLINPNPFRGMQMSNDDDAWHVRIPQRLRASVERIAIAEDRHPAQVVRRLLIRALQQHERSSTEAQQS
jgi:hypothetical protein